MTNRKFIAPRTGKAGLRRSVQVVLLGATILAGGAVLGCVSDDPESASLADLPVFATEQDLHVDGHTADLVPIGWMGVSSNGTIALIQGQDRGIRFFDSSGNDLGFLGGPGSGPGEFQRPLRAGWIGDTLWVIDTQLSRVSLISSEPAFLRTLQPLPGARPAPGNAEGFPEYRMTFPYAVYPGNTQLVAALGAAEVEGGRTFDGQPLFRVSSDGLIERMVIEIPRDPDGLVNVTFEGGSASGRVPFYPMAVWTVAADGGRIGLLTTDLSGPEAGTFRVSIFDALGDQVFSRAYPFSGVPLPSQVVDSVLERMAASAPHPEMKRVYQTEVKSRVPSIYPPAEDIVIGADGRIWIGLFGGEEDEPWLVLDPNGEPLGRVLLPHGTRLRVAGTAHVWGVERDELDVESIVRFRLSGKN